MVEINWGNFRAKFDGKEQATFEWLCYLLFCKEFNKNKGIPRYKNQAGIETNPISKGGQNIGWQAKFYDTRLSEHKGDLISAIDTAKERHPSISKIIFYLNDDFGQDQKKTDPPYKIDIEKHAKDKGIELEWRTKSYFESPFVVEENANIAKHFFLREKSVIDFINELTRNTETILDLVRSEIAFDGKTIKIDRSSFTETFKETILNYPLVIVSGEAGVGKTAIIKDFYHQIEDTTPLFVFKASEFNISNVNQLLKDYGDYTLADLIYEYRDVNEKYIIVDSAEKLSDVEHPEVFREFLSTLRSGGWKIIFTTRLSYLDDLKNEFIQIYNANFEPLNISNLTSKEINSLSKDYQFKLPQNERLQKLLRNPFYLSEYLQIYPTEEANISYVDFKDAIWNKRIAKSFYRKDNTHIKREDCFLKIVQKRVDSGSFFVTISGFEDDILARLEADEIIKFDPSARGYFITHDIYEEWALDKIIESAFRNTSDLVGFYKIIGSSLAIRRAFRSWLSEKLASNDADVLTFIETTVDNDEVERHWKDEALVAVLLSEHATTFIDHFEQRLLEMPERVVEHESSSPIVRSVLAYYKYENSILHRILFLLRIACKEIDQDFLKLIGISKFDGMALSTLVTKPKGRGWGSVISFINKHKEELGLTYLQFILPVLDDWNRNNKEGKTTKDASQIALFYFHELTKDGGFPYSSRDGTKDQIIRTIINGSFEVKEELRTIFNEIIAEKDTDHRSRYYEFVKVALSSLTESSEITKNLPKEIMRLANLFWFYIPKETGGYSDYRNDIEEYFDLEGNHFEHYPSSAFQTPTFQLLQVSPKEAIDFILSVTNRSVEYFAKSEFAKYEVEEIEIFGNSTGEPIKQYICHRIWNIYRGTQVAPALLESVHMALERWLLMVVAKQATPEALEKWCLYLIKNSRSASITAIVVSVVLAEPSKLFNVARILFRTKELFFFDISRLQLDMMAKGNYSISHDPNGIFKNERLSTCEDKHRNISLENQAFNYQLFASEDEGKKAGEKRQEILGKIFDEYYKQLPDRSKETENDKMWRLSLARMDRRRMNVTTENKDNQIQITFSPEIDRELKQYSEDSLAKSNESLKHISLQMWSQNKFDGKTEECKKYPQYEEDYKLVISETKETIKELRNDKSEDEGFKMRYHSIPPYTCAVLIRDYFGELNYKEKDFCKNVILEYATKSLNVGYRYNFNDGVNVAIKVLPLLLRPFAQNSKEIKEILLFALFDSSSIGMSQHFSDFSVSAIINHLWSYNSADANALFLGYLLLKPKFDDLRESIRKEDDKKDIYSFSIPSVLERFRVEQALDISNVISNQITYDDIPDLKDIDCGVLVTAFLLLPVNTTDKKHKKFVCEIALILSEKLFKRDSREDRFDHTLKHQFLQKFAYFVLSSKETDIKSYLEPFIQNFADSREVTEALSEFIFAEDRLNEYEKFWTVWNLFYPKIVELCTDRKRYMHLNNIVHTYLFAWELWDKGIREWHSLKDRDRIFFKKVVEDIGDHPSVLYSISKLLNDVGSGFVDDGISWISNILQKNPDLASKELEVNTIFYLENVLRGYILRNRYKIRTTPQIKEKVLITLNFLLEKGSVTAYLLREDIL